MEKKVIQYASRDAVQYAQRWALSRNRDYNDFTKGGGDCMNFVSQCQMCIRDRPTAAATRILSNMVIGDLRASRMAQGE